MTNLIPMFLALASGAAAILFFGFGLSGYMAQGQRVSRRLMGEQGAVVDDGSDKLVRDDARLQEFDKYLTPTDDEKTSKIKHKLALAGYRSPAAVRLYFAWKWGITITGFLLGAIVFAATMNPARPLIPVMLLLLTVTLCYFAADMWVGRAIAYRRQDVEKAFPDALDLMLVCIEAGHGLDQAMHRVSREMATSAPVLSEEMSLLVAQLRAGKERDQVMADFSERCGVDDVTAFVTVIKQANNFGVSIADTLRVYASEMRHKRFMRAEEKANMMPVKLALGAIVFTVPPVIMVLIGPSIIMIVRELARATSGA